PSAPTPTPVASVTAPALDSPANNQQLDNLRPTLTVRNATSDQTGTRTYEFQISDNPAFTAANTSNIPGFAATVGKTGVAEGTGGKTSFTPDSDLQPTTLFNWRARAVQGTTTGPWSASGTFKSKLVGYNRPGELYDPLIHGETVGQIVGSATFIPGRGLQLNQGAGFVGFVKYVLPQTISSGEFSMEVEGLRANGPGDKAKVFGMQQGPDDSDFVTNKYRIDVQYRGANGVPPNCIQFRVLYGSATDTSVRYEPDTAKRNASVYLLDASTTYYWQATWGSVFRLAMLQGGIGGSTVYDYSIPTPKGSYQPSPHYAYLGAPPARSGPEAASIPGSIYRNVWLSNRPRPASLGSAIRGRF
ncbi:MAG: hypothetical protein ABJC89_04330, partial [Acidobacteriota bacterium]